MKLQYKIALVTGAARGIGRGIALALAREGADVAVTDIVEGIEDVAEEIRALQRRSIAFTVDVRKQDEVEAMVERTVADLGRLDIMVNNAGVLSIRPIAKLTVDDWDFMFDVNAKGVFLGSKAAVRVMRKQGGGTIINTASIAGKEGYPGMSHYSASKFAVVGFTNALAKEVAKENITVNAICPGIVGTSMWVQLADELKAKNETVEESWARHQVALIPQGRAQTPEDMGELAVFFASMPNVTGQSVNVDGGQTSH